MPTVGSSDGGEVDLEGGDLDHVVAAHPRRIERQDRRADIAAELHVALRRRQEMRDQRRRGRLAVGAGDRDEGRVGDVPPPLAAEELDVADDLDAGCLGQSTVQCGSGWVSGTPGASTSAAKSRHSASPRSTIGIPAAAAASTRRHAVVPGRDARPAGGKRAAVARPLPPRPKTATFLPSKLVTGIMAALT